MNTPLFGCEYCTSLLFTCLHSNQQPVTFLYFGYLLLVEIAMEPYLLLFACDLFFWIEVDKWIVHGC